MKHYFKNQIAKIVSLKGTYVYENSSQRRVQFDVDSEFTFEQAHQISDLLGTNKIKLRSGVNKNGCDTCGFGDEYWISVEASEVMFPE